MTENVWQIAKIINKLKILSGFTFWLTAYATAHCIKAQPLTRTEAGHVTATQKLGRGD